MASYPTDIRKTPLLGLLADDDAYTAVHAIVAASRLLTDEALDNALGLIGASERQSASIVRAIAASQCNPVEAVASSLGSASSRSSTLVALLTCITGARPMRGIHSIAGT